MTLSQRIRLLTKLGEYMEGNSEEWRFVKQQAYQKNGWFLPEFTDLAVKNIVTCFLQESILTTWAGGYSKIKENTPAPKLVGLVMAGNIPLVGFHDFLCIFVSGNNGLIKTSSKDEVLFKHLVQKLTEWEPAVASYIQFADLLKGCDAYIATGSDNTAGYFDYYFGKYPHLIRRNRTSVAILSGNETPEALEALADDIHVYFGMGCRNVTKIYVPENYHFEPLINSFKKYDYLADVHKYKNNYDYNLAIHLLNNRYYMSSASTLIVEDTALFSPVSQLNYQYYTNRTAVLGELVNNASIQCILGKDCLPFGTAQSPKIDQYADGEDTMAFLTSLS